MTNPSLPKTPTAARRLQIERERAAVLHFKFTGIAERSSERALAKRLGSIARRLHGQPFKTVPDAQWKISQKTILRAFYAWRRGGQTPDALLRYRDAGHRRRRLTADHLVHFIDELSKPCTRSGVDAFKRLCGDPLHPLPVSYSRVMRALPPRSFRRLRAARASVEHSSATLADVRGTIVKHALASVAATPGATEEQPASWEI